MNHRIEVQSKSEMPRQNKTYAIKNAVLKQHIFFTVIFITNFSLANCNWMSVYVPKIDATCALLAKKINYIESYYIERQFCSFESCVAICFQHQYPCNSIKYTRFAKQCELYIRNATYHSLPEDDETGQSRHFLLHSCHKAVSVGKLIHTPSMDADTTTANIHLPSIHRMCVVQKRPFVESYGIQRLQQITTSSLRLCLAACEAPTYSSCNSVLFSAQEETCILLARPQAFRFLGGTSATVETAAQYFINLFCRNDYKVGAFHTMQSFGRQPVIAYADSNSHMQILINHELFYGTKAAIRLQLWGSADEKECMKICIASIATDYCDAYYFSSRENTCLTMRMRKPYTFPVRHGQLIITKFYDDETLDVTVRDESEEYITYPDHFTELEVSLHEFKEICVTQHWISTLIPNVAFSKQYGNIVFFHECIHICRHLKNSGECKGIAYSKKMKTCMIAVDGNKNGEILLSNDQQYVTLSSCKKDRETERANNTRHVFFFIPELDEMCLLELYEPLRLSGWKTITTIENTVSLQECLSKCASVMNVQKCSAVNFIDEQCMLLGRAKRTSFVRSRYSIFAELLYCELKSNGAVE
ncbi:putative PAN domain protein [Trichinella spiralis]|uniref:putative PAN domain protein n=1 Tax=Trichinella spiralis TaxID=6334 RepID=UPI0001EFBC5C|nr:putative PAN domain protein [Trichinella spiralis]